MIVARHTVARSARANARAGFTLMEVMVVAAILVILAGVGSVALFSYLETAKEKAAAATVHKIEEAVMTYKLKKGAFPDNLEILTQAVGSMPASLEPSDLVDPWNNAYGYDPHTLSATGRPKIFVTNPPDPSSPISNW
jgi:general secretion pathway protein G